MANDKKNKKSKGQGQPVKMTPEKYIRERARKLPIGKCYINPDWKESSLATIAVTRERADGKLVVGMYLTDLGCLGVKDVIYKADMDPDDLIYELNNIYRNGEYEEITYPEAHNLIYGAIEFAEEADIKPHKDFGVAEYILEEDTDAIPLIEYEFGKDGKHFLVIGPSGKEMRYMKQLRDKFGDDFHYLGPADIIMDDTGKYDYLEDEEYEEYEDEYFEDEEEEYDEEWDAKIQDQIWEQMMKSMERMEERIKKDQKG